jgi:isoquinoline 1-oxidoreductase beta subunit
MITIENVSRRQFLEGMLSAGGFVLCASLAPRIVMALDAAAVPIDGTVLHPTIFVGIDSDGTVHIVAHRSDMGTGTRTSLPRVVADELDADWDRVKVQQALGDARYGDQDTDGSHSVRDFFDVMRQSGATARFMLVSAAAERWNVPASECITDPVHTVVHPKTGRKLGYGELAAAAAKLPVPKKEDLKFKPRSSWRYIGKPAAHYDLEDQCTGKSVFGMDVRRDGMVYAAIAHPPVLGGKIKSYDDKAALQVKGVKQTVAIDPFKPPHEFQPLGGVAVIADNTWSAFKGRRNLRVDWDHGPNAAFDSDTFRKQMQETSRKPGKVVRNIGDVDAEFAKGGKVLEADYYTPMLAHVSMEPPVAVAEYRDGKVTAWACTQNPQGVQDTIAKVLGIKKEDVTCHVTLLGGGFGRKSKPDFVAEAAVLSKKLGKPVKVVWSREDDVQFDYYHTTAAMYLKAALDSSGKPTAWLQRSVFPPIGSTFGIDVRLGDTGEMSMGWNNIPFDLPNHRAENGEASAHVRIGWLRSVANIYHAFSVQSFANELAYAAGREPLEYLLSLIGPARLMKEADDANQDDPSAVNYPFDIGRLRHVTELAAEKAGWGKRKFAKGAGQGIAVHRSFLSYVATVVEVEVGDDGTVRIPRVDTVLDAGTIVNPDTVRAQFEGAAVFGTSIARTGEITSSHGVINQSNFHDYQVTRMNQAPYQTNVHIVESDAPPAGVGEPGVPPFTPALCNAIFAATGKRVRELPLSRNGFS